MDPVTFWMMFLAAPHANPSIVLKASHLFSDMQLYGHMVASYTLIFSELLWNHKFIFIKINFYWKSDVVFLWKFYAMKVYYHISGFFRESAMTKQFANKTFTFCYRDITKMYCTKTLA